MSLSIIFTILLNLNIKDSVSQKYKVKQIKEQILLGIYYIVICVTRENRRKKVLNF